MTCDFQQCVILTNVDSDKPVQPPFKIRSSMFGQCPKSYRMIKRLATALMRLHVSEDWFEPLLLAHTTLLENHVAAHFL